MIKTICVAAILLGASTALFAAPVPEIDATTGSSALALLVGGLVVIRARYKK